MNKTTAFALLVSVMAAPAFAQDYPPATNTQSTDSEMQMKAEDAQKQAMPPGTTTEQTRPSEQRKAAEQTTTSNDAADAMTSNDASAAMQATGAATAATATGVSTAIVAGNVVVTSQPGNSISSNYRIDFAGLDRNGDGHLSHGEVNASGNEDLIREFVAVDINRNGRLSKDELKGWTD